MKLEKDQQRVVSAAMKAGAITRSQRAELVRVAESLGPLSPRTIGLAVAVLRSGGLAEAERRAQTSEAREELSRARGAFEASCSGVETRAVQVCTRGGKRTDTACAPKATRFELSGAVGWLGGRTEVVVEGSMGLASLPARWALLPVGSLLTSHDPMQGFRARPGYPSQLQERDYEKGETEQQKVRSAASNLYPELLLSDNRDALTGAPILDRMRRVLGGNGRAMALALHLASDDNDRRYARALRSELACNTCFGLAGAPLQPDSVLVRVLDRVDDVLSISRALNAPLSAAMTRETEAFSLGQRLSDRTIGRIGDALANAETMNEAIDELGATLVGDLMADGIIVPSQRPAWLVTLGGGVGQKLNRTARERIVDALVALSVRDQRVIRDATPSVLQLLTQLAPVVIRFDRWDAANRSGYSWTAAYRRALPFLVATQAFARDTAELRSYWGTRSLFEAPEDGLDASTLAEDAEGSTAYWWLVSLLGRPKVAAERAKKTWVAVPNELRGEKALWGLRDRLELAEIGEDPWSIRQAAGWPSQPVWLDMGSKGAIGELTRQVAALKDWDRAIYTFNEHRKEGGAIKMRQVLIEAWLPEVVPLRMLSKVAEEERARMIESLRPVEAADFELSPFEAPTRATRQPRPTPQAKPWAALRAAGLPLALSKRLVGLGIADPAELRAVLERGEPIAGMGKARRAALRASLGLPPEEKKARRKREKLAGGRADGVPDEAFPPLQLVRGELHELEHTDDPQVAAEIAKDHLAEDPAYYQKLETREEIDAKLADLHSDYNEVLRELDTRGLPLRREIELQQEKEAIELEGDKLKARALDLLPTVGRVDPSSRLNVLVNEAIADERERLDASLMRKAQREQTSAEIVPISPFTVSRWFELRGWKASVKPRDPSAGGPLVRVVSPAGVELEADLLGVHAFDPSTGKTWRQILPITSLGDLSRMFEVGTNPPSMSKQESSSPPRNTFDAALRKRTAAVRETYAQKLQEAWDAHDSGLLIAIENAQARLEGARQLLEQAEAVEIDEGARHGFKEAVATRERVYAEGEPIRELERKLQAKAQLEADARQAKRIKEQEQGIANLAGTGARRARLEARQERREEWAAKAEKRSDAAFQSAHQIAGRFEFGQPILVGHHSERKARADQERMHSAMGRAVEEGKLAQHHAAKAAGLEGQLDRAIFSDDVDALPALRARIESLKAQHAARLELNAKARKLRPKPKDRAEMVAALVKAGHVEATDARRFLLSSGLERDTAPHPAYQIQNGAAEIRRNENRLAYITGTNEKFNAAKAAGGVLFEVANDQIRVTFAEKPDRSIIEELKAAGFYWRNPYWSGPFASLPGDLREQYLASSSSGDTSAKRSANCPTCGGPRTSYEKSRNLQCAACTRLDEGAM